MQVKASLPDSRFVTSKRNKASNQVSGQNEADDVSGGDQVALFQTFKFKEVLECGAGVSPISAFSVTLHT